MERCTRSAALAVLAVLFAAGAVPASARCTFYVRANHVPPAGSVADGRTPGTAFARIGQGAAAVNNPGEVVCVGPGTYVEGNITPAWYGTADFPIVFLADRGGTLTGGSSGGRVEVVMPAAPTLETAGFRLLGHHHVVIDGFTVRGFSDAGIQVRSAGMEGVPPGLANGHDVTLRNNEVRDNPGTGIDVSGEGTFVVENNRVHDNGGSGISLRGCIDAAAQGEPGFDPRCRAGTSPPLRPRVSNNRVGRNGAHGVFVLGAEDGVVQNNVAFSNQATGMTLRAAARFLVVNNLVYANREDGLAFGTADRASPNARVMNNTLHANGGWGLRIGSVRGASPEATVLDNIVTANGTPGSAAGGGIGVLTEADARRPSTCGYTAGFNLVYENADDRNYGPETPFNVYDLRLDPRFVSPAGRDGVLGARGADDDDFRLRPESPARDAGAEDVLAVGLTGSTEPAAQGEAGPPDNGPVDLGYHYGARADQTIMVPLPFMPLYVRPDGDDAGGGKSREQALRTIAAAGRLARAGVTVSVAPGLYQECDLGPPQHRGRASFIAEASGDPADVPVVDASCCGPSCVLGQTGFNLLRACMAEVKGFHVTGALDAGIQVQSGSHGAVVENNVSFANLRLGIQVVNADDVRIVNNLVHRNGGFESGAPRGGGIQVGGSCARPGCEDAGAKNALVQGNTLYGNAVNGVLIGAGAGVSSGATVRYNILQANGENGIQLGSDGASAPHLDAEYALRSRFNVNLDGYGAATPRGFGDLVVPPGLDPRFFPLFVDPERDDFHLMQLGAGQGAQSRAVDYGDVDAAAAGMSAASTRTDDLPDRGRLDIGYHYRACGLSDAGDCDASGRVAVSELVLGVTIALGLQDLEVCAVFDRDGDGTVDVGEIVGAVRNALFGCV